MALKVRPFRGIRYDFKKTSLKAALCPPYDVIGADLARRLRAGRVNAVHLELPGAGAANLARARRLWLRWRKSATLVRESAPAYYLVEQAFKFRGRSYRRTGLLAALGLDAPSAARVMRHEKTLAKPKKERLRVLRTMRANTSPIFGIFPDPGAVLRREFEAVKRMRPSVSGSDQQGVGVKVWIVTEPRRLAKIERAFRSKRLLIADGHHRFEVARDFWKAARAPGSDSTLAYLAAEEDAGLVVDPTHRVVVMDAALRAKIDKLTRPRRAASLSGLEAALSRAGSPYAFGLVNGRMELRLPAAGVPGVKSRFGADWLKRRLLAGIDPQDISYFHSAAEAARAASADPKRAAFLLAPFKVADIRRGVARGGLLPQKSTYFYPKIATGIVFRAFDS